MATLKYYDTATLQWKTLLVGAKGEQGDPGPTGADSTVPGPGVASGGTTGQFLVKASNDEYDTQWATLPTDTDIMVIMGAY